MNRLSQLLTVIMLVGLANPAWTQERPRCPSTADITTSPEAPTAIDNITLTMFRYPGTHSAFWELIENELGQLHFNLQIGWGGGLGPPVTHVVLDPLHAGSYQLLISPFLGSEPEDACPLLSIPLNVAGAPSAAVPAPLFSLPGLLVMMLVLALAGWTTLRRH